MFSTLTFPFFIAMGTFSELVTKNIDFGVPVESKKAKKSKKGSHKKPTNKTSKNGTDDMTTDSVQALYML